MNSPDGLVTEDPLCRISSVLGPLVPTRSCRQEPLWPAGPHPGSSGEGKPGKVGISPRGQSPTVRLRFGVRPPRGGRHGSSNGLRCGRGRHGADGTKQSPSALPGVCGSPAAVADDLCDVCLAGLHGRSDPV